MLRNPETKYIAFNDVQITLAWLALNSSINDIVR